MVRKERLSLSHCNAENKIILPREARDKHRESREEGKRGVLVCEGNEAEAEALVAKLGAAAVDERGDWRVLADADSFGLLRAGALATGAANAPFASQQCVLHKTINLSQAAGLGT